MRFSCDVCGLPDPYRGQGDGIGSCDCPRCDGGEAADGSAVCICPDPDDGIGSCDCPRCDGGEAADGSAVCICPDPDDGPACWAPSTPPGSCPHPDPEAVRLAALADQISPPGKETTDRE